MKNIQAPTSKLQRSTKHQAPIFCERVGTFLKFGSWRLSGACPSPLRSDAIAPKLEAKAASLEFGTLQ